MKTLISQNADILVKMQKSLLEAERKEKIAKKNYLLSKEARESIEELFNTLKNKRIK